MGAVGTYDAEVDDQDALIAWLDLTRVSAIVRRDLDRALTREAGIGLTEGEVMYQLVFAPEERLRMSDLADRTCLTQSSMTRVVDRLVRRGFATRDVRASDRRTVDVRLTSAGRETFERLRPAYMSVVRERFAGDLGPMETRRLREILGGVLEGLGAAEDIPWAEARRRRQG
jgi:DNA-binding MarR family transcriptional regulator